MIIFLSNDDGIQAPLLPITVEALSKIGDVYVCVPEKEFSSGGHGLSPHNPLWLREVQIPHAVRAWTLSGTPADCVKFAFAKLLDVRPDLVVGGINPSPNMATEVLYSGTVAAAIEGCLHGIPSIAMSQNSSKCDPREAAKCLIDIIVRWQRNGFQPTTTLSVNYPELPFGEIKGYAFARQGWRWYNDCFLEMQDPKGRIFYWMHGNNLSDRKEEGTDLAYMEKGYVPITPLSFDMTDYAMIDQLKKTTIFDEQRKA